jgi:hypothetical protein
MCPRGHISCQPLSKLNKKLFLPSSVWKGTEVVTAASSLLRLVTKAAGHRAKA